MVATTICKDREVNGITVGDTECKLSRYADDTILILHGAQKSLERCFAILDKFSEISGMRVSCEKKLKLFGLAPRRDQTRLYALKKILNGQMEKLRP